MFRLITEHSKLWRGMNGASIELQEKIYHKGPRKMRMILDRVLLVTISYKLAKLIAANRTQIKDKLAKKTKPTSIPKKTILWNRRYNNQYAKPSHIYMVKANRQHLLLPIRYKSYINVVEPKILQNIQTRHIEKRFLSIWRIKHIPPLSAIYARIPRTLAVVVSQARKC